MPADVFCSICPFVTKNKSYLNIHITNRHKDVDVRRPYRTVDHKDGLPGHSFIAETSRIPKLLIDGFLIKFEKNFVNLQGQKFAYFYCTKKLSQKCKASAKAVLIQKADGPKEDEKYDENSYNLIFQNHDFEKENYF